MKWVRAQLPHPALCPVPCRVCQPPLSPQCPGRGLLGPAQLCPLHLPRVPLPVSVRECSLLGWGHTRSTPDAGRGRRESLILTHAHVPWHMYAVLTSARLCLSLSGKLLLISQGLTLKSIPLSLGLPLFL